MAVGTFPAWGSEILTVLDVIVAKILLDNYFLQKQL